MNTPVPPTPPSSTVLQNVPTGNTSTATIVQSTITQSSLQLGQNVAATVLSRIAPGQFSIQTDLGQLTLQTAANLVLGQSLNVQIQSLGARPLLLLLPPQTSAAGAPQTQAPQVTGDTSTLTQGSVTKATVLRSGQAGATPGAGAARNFCAKHDCTDDIKRCFRHTIGDPGRRYVRKSCVNRHFR